MNKKKIEERINNIKGILSPVAAICDYVSRDKNYGFGLCKCLYPNCNNEKTIHSHLHSRKFLKNIADDSNEVLVFNHKFDINELKKGPRLIHAHDVNIKSATVFLGFCGEHDNKIFSPFEDENKINNKMNIFETKNQCDYYAYRVIMFQKFNLYAKKQSLKIPFKENGVDISMNDEARENSILNNNLVKKFINNKPENTINDLEHYVIKIKGNLNLINNIFLNYKVLSYLGYFIKADNPHSIIGRLLLDSLNKKDIYMILNVIATQQEESTIILTWDRKNKHIEDIHSIIYLLKKIVSNPKINSIFLSYLYTFNLYYSDWLVIKKGQDKYLDENEIKVFNNIIYNHLYNNDYILNYNRMLKYNMFLPKNSNFIKNKGIKKEFLFSCLNKKETLKYLRNKKKMLDNEIYGSQILLNLFNQLIKS